MPRTTGSFLAAALVFFPACSGNGAGASETGEAGDSAGIGDSGDEDGISDPFVEWTSPTSEDWPGGVIAHWIGTEERPTTLLVSSEQDICPLIQEFESDYESIVEGIVEAGGTSEEGVEAAEREFRSRLATPCSILRLDLADAPDIDALAAASGLEITARFGVEDRSHVYRQGETSTDVSVVLQGSSDVMAIAGEAQGEILLRRGCEDSGADCEEENLTLGMAFSTTQCETEYVPRLLPAD